MTESWITVLLAGGPLLWMLGGSGVPPFRKQWRRTVWGAVAASAVLMSGHGVQAGLIFGVLVVVNSLPYGDRTPWVIRVPVFMALCAPALILNLGAWPVVLVGGALISGMAWATRRWNFVSHKLWEGWAGLIQSGVIVAASLIP